MQPTVNVQEEDEELCIQEKVILQTPHWYKENMRFTMDIFEIEPLLRVQLYPRLFQILLAQPTKEYWYVSTKLALAAR